MDRSGRQTGGFAMNGKGKEVYRDAFSYMGMSKNKFSPGGR